MSAQIAKRPKNVNSRLSAALGYATKLRWYVVPCNGKVPLIKDWPKRASKNPEQIKRWWREFPDANISIAAGKSGLCVLDVDGEEGQQSLTKLRGNKRPRTVRAKTGGGGEHSVFKRPEGGLKNRTRIMPGLDIKCDGGLFVVAPSIHESGSPYRWKEGQSPFECEVKAAPPWLLELVWNGSKEGKPTDHPIELDLAKMLKEGIRGGERDDTLFRLMLRLKRLRALEDLEFIAKLVQKHLTDEGHHPFTEQDALKCARSAWKSEYTDTVLGKEETGLEIWDSKEPKPQWIIRGFIREGLALLAGPSKGGKSWIALEMALSVVLNGRKCFDSFKAETCQALYVDLEDTAANNKVRLRKLMSKRRDANLSNLKVRREWPPGESGADTLEDYLRDHLQIKLVVIDCLARVRASRKKNQDLLDYDYKTLACYRRVAHDFHVAVVVIHHFNKGAGLNDEFDRISGSTGLQAVPDTLIAYDGKRGARGGKVQITGRVAKDKAFAIERDSDERPIWKDAEEYEFTTAQKEVIQQLREVHPDSMSPRDLSDIVGTKPGTMRKRLLTMKNKGLIEAIGDGRNTRYRAIKKSKRGDSD